MMVFVWGCGPKTTATPDPQPDTIDEEPVDNGPEDTPVRVIFHKGGDYWAQSCLDLLEAGNVDEAVECRYEGEGEPQGYDLLVPLGCYIEGDGWQSWGGDGAPAACLAPEGQLVSLDEQGVAIDGPPLLEVCDASGDMSWGVVASWGEGSTSAIVSLQAPDAQANLPQEAPVQPKVATVIAAELDRLISELPEPPNDLMPMEVVQSIVVDLDGDGVADQLISAHRAHPEDITFLVSGMFLVRGSAPDE